MNKGIFYALFAYIFWGSFPIFWKLLKHVPVDEIVAQRIVWSLVFFIIVISFRKGWKGFYKKFTQTKKKWILFLPALIIGSNWGVFIWAITGEYVIETSLGYYICPIITVFLGVIFLGEDLRRLQWVSIIIAGMGVLLMTFMYGEFPWISLFLAGTWSIYGLLRKQSPLNADEGLALEMVVLVIPAIIYIYILGQNNESMFFFDTRTTILFLTSGIVSGLPLLIFIAGARLINLTLIGILQYIYPTIIFLLGIFLYDEPFDEGKIIGFSFIWLALIVFTIEGTYYLKTKSLVFNSK